MTAVPGIFVREGTAERRGLQRNHKTTSVPIEAKRTLNVSEINRDTFRPTCR